MLLVALYVNFNCVGSLTAQRVKGTKKANSVGTYKLDDGTLIRHRYGDGAEALAIKMLENRKQRYTKNKK